MTPHWSPTAYRFCICPGGHRASPRRLSGPFVQLGPNTTIGGADFENLDTHCHNLYFDSMNVALTPACPEQPADLRGLG